MFTKENIDTIGLRKHLNTVIISMHASTEKTYNKLVENGNFKALMTNIKYLSKLKQDGILQNLQLNFVVTAINYKEMKNFVKLAKKLKAKAFFINYHRQIDSDELMQKLDISLPTHPKYNSLVKILKHPIFKEECCVLNDYLKELKPNEKKLTNILKDLFKK